MTDRFLKVVGVLLVIFSVQPTLSYAESIGTAMKYYSESGALSFDASRGEQFWRQKHTAEDGSQRSCGTCHGDDLKASGKHKKTGKVIDPMALSVNAERYTKMKKVKKWFKRNCKWTLGRECTNQEKGDVLQYLSQFK